ncbi:MAG: hypothetical protein U9R74_00260 [Pseudomonadota bacterium]|nr:hypothetical protein [Pseudomonadota bacterium]
MEFLADMYLCVEALGSDAVQKVVPLADPGTRESLRIPLEDELDYIAFGVGRLREELARMPGPGRKAFLDGLPGRIDAMGDRFETMGLEVSDLFESAGADFEDLYRSVTTRRDEVPREVAEPLAACDSARLSPASRGGVKPGWGQV